MGRDKCSRLCTEGTDHGCWGRILGAQEALDKLAMYVEDGSQVCVCESERETGEALCECSQRTSLIMVALETHDLTFQIRTEGIKGNFPPSEAYLQL